MSGLGHCVVAAPADLYDRPANVFVAGFIGNPPMNLFPTRITSADGGSLRLSIADQALSLTHTDAIASGAHASAIALTAGIRPEAVRLATDGPAISATVEHVEYLGHETLAHLRADAAESEATVRLIARLPGMQELTTGANVSVQIDESRLHLFDAQGVALA